MKRPDAGVMSTLEILLRISEVLVITPAVSIILLPWFITKNMVFKFLVAFACWIGLVSGQEQPDVITIESLTYAGTGCPSNTVASSISNDRTTFTLIFDEYVATMEPGGSIRDTRKNCQINVGLRVPQGWSYSVGTVDYRGYMYLEEGTYASQGALYYFSGEEAQTDRLETRWDGPEDRDYTIRDSFPITALVWSACGAPANLNIKSDLRVAGEEGKTGLLTTDSIDGKVSHIYGLQWEQC